MQLRNIHFTNAAVSNERPTPVTPQPTEQPIEETRLRLRKVKLSPADEYTARSGQPRPISMSLAALILSKTGKAEVKPKGVLVDRKDIGRAYFWHPDSRLCNDLSQRSRKIFYVYTDLQPDRIHCLDDTGTYLETLPRSTNVDAFDVEASQKAHADKNRQISRVAAHMQRIHQPDTAAALAAASHNAMEMQRVVQAMPAPITTTTETAPSPMADRISRAATDPTHTYTDLTPSPATRTRQTSIPATTRHHPTAADLLLAAAESDPDF